MCNERGVKHMKNFIYFNFYRLNRALMAYVSHLSFGKYLTPLILVIQFQLSSQKFIQTGTTVTFASYESVEFT